ncbi:hypothetical protein AB0G71_30140 [Streptomyces sp. NPDC020403]|uniref:hypothetical protein n=1 Tax=unclassified Streptomyces TaxID=2593676 RepID=UPI0033FD1F59
MRDDAAGQACGGAPSGGPADATGLGGAAGEPEPRDSGPRETPPSGAVDSAGPGDPADGDGPGPVGVPGRALDSVQSPAQSPAQSPGGSAGVLRAAVRAPEIAYHPAPRPLVRHGSADPVKVLMHRHRDLCARAVDPLEIAAGLEAHGLTDRAAARYRHRDVFSLAEELYARAPRAERPGPPPSPDPGRRATGAWSGWTLLALLPGAACLATAGALRGTEGVLGGGSRLAVTAAGALLVHLGLRLCLRTGPLRAPDGAGGVTLYVCWLLGYAVYGEDLLHQVISGGPDGHWNAAPAPLLGLALAVAPATWCAHLFSAGARHRLTGSHALADFGGGVRPLLLGVVALFLCATTALLYLAGLGYGGDGALLAPAALGVLLLLARLLAVHGFPEAAATGLAAACAVEAAAPFLVLAGRLPGLDLLARPVDTVVREAGAAGVPALACGIAALGLLIHASVTLSRASTHATVQAVDAPSRGADAAGLPLAPHTPSTRRNRT